jgi:hypothetical protein
MGARDDSRASPQISTVVSCFDDLPNDRGQHVCRNRTDLQQFPNAFLFVTLILRVYPLLDIVGVSIGGFPSYMGSHSVRAALCN